MLKRAGEWLAETWWGLIISYFLLVAGSYVVIWTVVEPLAIPDQFETLWLFMYERWFYHVLFALLVGAHMTLLLDLRQRRTIWAKVQQLHQSTSTKLPFDHVYETTSAKDFYDAIARHYDQRNSSELLNTHRQVVRLIDAQARDREMLEVLDLGGGTGKLIVQHFFDRNTMRWHYVDVSSGMADQFRENFMGTKLDWSVELEDIHAFLKKARKQQYDVVLLSLVLTSMDRDPEWQALASVVKPGGRLIIADIDPLYTSLHPYYAIIVEQEHYALKPRGVSLTQIIHDVEACGLKLNQTFPIAEGRINYSFVVEFSK
jgi:ubiquinone/menaquinone biosynthesis C-methylase UbiE